MPGIPEALQAARLRCADKRPYLAQALWAITPIARKGLGTFAVDDRWRMYYDPDLTWTPAQFASALYHEVNHLLRVHHDRVALDIDPDVQRWQKAADCEINGSLMHEDKGSFGFELPKTHLVQPEDFKLPVGETAEWYYEHLPVELQGKAVDCGSCSDGRPRDYEEPRGDDGGKEDDKNPNRGLGKGEADLVRRSTAAAIEEAAGRGDVPEHLKRWAGSILKPKADWRKLLRAAVRRSVAEAAGMTDFTYSRPSRRQIPDVILPSLKGPIPEVSIVIDTSGSISQETLTKATAEVKGVLSSLGRRKGVTVIACDAAVHSVRSVWSASAITSLEGGGGTDMGEGIRAAMAQRRKPDVIVVLTDGYTPWPTEAPSARLVVGLIGESVANAGPVYGRTVRIQ